MDCIVLLLGYLLTLSYELHGPPLWISPNIECMSQLFGYLLMLVYGLHEHVAYISKYCILPGYGLCGPSLSISHNVELYVKKLLGYF